MVRSLQNHKLHGNGTEVTGLSTASVCTSTENAQLKHVETNQRMGFNVQSYTTLRSSWSEDIVDEEGFAVYREEHARRNIKGY